MKNNDTKSNRAKHQDLDNGRFEKSLGWNIMNLRLLFKSAMFVAQGNIVHKIVVEEIL